MLYRQNKAQANAYVSLMDIVKMTMMQALHNPERLWSKPPGGGEGGGLMLTNRLRMPAVHPIEHRSYASKEEILLVSLFRLSMKLSDIFPEGYAADLPPLAVTSSHCLSAVQSPSSVRYAPREHSACGARCAALDLTCRRWRRQCLAAHVHRVVGLRPLATRHRPVGGYNIAWVVQGE